MLQMMQFIEAISQYLDFQVPQSFQLFLDIIIKHTLKLKNLKGIEIAMWEGKWLSSQERGEGVGITQTPNLD